jgi:hypothetical protein
MSLRDTLERIRSNPVPPNEETAKVQVLIPILLDLGWDPFGPEVLWEYSVGETKSGGRVDVALTAEGRTRALIEAKAPGANLDSHVKQVLGYAFEEGVDICVLTDGLTWWLYLPREQGLPSKRRFAVLRLDKDPIDQFGDDLNTFLSRPSLVGGQANNRAKQVLKALHDAAHLEKEMPRIWREMLDKPDDELIELIGQRAYSKLNLRPERKQIIAAMQQQPIPPMTLDSATGGPIPASVPTSPAPPASRSRRPATGGPIPASVPTAILLWGKRHPVSKHYEIVTTVVEELYQRHSDTFEQTIEPLSTKEKHWVSRDRQRVRGNTPKQTPSGCFVQAHGNKAAHRRRWTQLLEAFGYDESVLEIRYDDTPPEASSPRTRTPRPVAVLLWGVRHPVQSHQEVLTTVVEELYRRHPDDFDHAVETLRAGEWQYVSRNPQRVRGTRIRQTPAGHYLDVNLSARDIRKRAIRLMEALGHSESDLEYLYEG